MPKVQFTAAYKNGQIGIDVGAGEVIDLSKKEIEQVAADMRNPKDGMKVLGGKKKDDKPADDKG